MISNRSRQAARTGWTGLVISDAHQPMARTLDGAGHSAVGTPSAHATKAPFAVAYMANDPAPPPRGNSPV